MQKESAFSGLEAAIVLIAFVVVAAVFSYVMLGAGFFATQKSQEVTYSGIKQSTSNLVLDGQLYGVMETSTYANIEHINFWLSIPEGGQPQDLSEVVYVITVEGKKYTKDTEYKINAYSPTGILQPGSRTKGDIQFLTPQTNGPAPGQSFTIEIKPKVGASSLITKTLATGFNGGVII